MSFIQQFFTSRDNNANAETFVGQEGRLWWDPVSNQIYSSDGNTPGGIPLAGGGGGNGSPGGSNSQVQFNQNSTFGGSANLTFDRTNGTLTAVSFVGNGAALTSITGSNVTGTVANATYATSAGSATTATSATTAATVTTAAQPNITSVGTLTSITSTGNISTTGNITGVYILGNGSQLTGITTSYGNANVADYLASGTDTANIITTGNISGTYFIGNGSQLTGISGSTYGNANVAAYLPTYTGNLAGALLSVSGNVTGSYIFANGSGLTSLTGANVTGTVANATYALTSNSATYAGTVTTNAQPNITSVGTLTSLSSTGNVTGNYFIGNGSQLTGITSSYGNSNVVSLLAGFGSNTVSTTGNVTGGYFIGNGYALTSVNASNVTGQVANALVAATVYTAAQPNITSVGTLTSLTVTGNASGGNVLTGGQVSAAGNVTGGNLITSGLITATSNVTGGNLLTAGLVSATGNVTGGNLITSGVLSVAGNISVSGNITAGNLIGTLIGNLTGTTASLSGNVTAANLISNSRLFVANGTLTAPSIAFSGDTGQDSGFFLLGDGNIGITTNAGTRVIVHDSGMSVIGNITSGNVLGGANVNATTHTGATVSVTGNITGSNVTTTGAVYSNYNTNTANTGSFMATGGNTRGGTGYLDFLVVQNTSSGATNPYKWLRVNSTGGLEILNSAYSAISMAVSDSGIVNANQYQVGSKQAVNGPAFRAYIDSNQAITSGSQQKVTFNSETFDTNSNFASSRFTPTVEGYYQLNATVRIAGGSGTGEGMITIWKNGSEYARGHNESGTEQGTSFYSMQVSDLAYANGTTDYFEIYIQQGSGSNKDTTAGQNISYFSGAMVRGA